MSELSTAPASDYSTLYSAPPRIHWALLLVGYLAAAGLVLWLKPGFIRDFLTNLFIAAWPIYLCTWIRKIDRGSLSLYWALASFATGFLFSWLLWMVVIFEIREELLEHYNRREPIGLRLNWLLTLFFSFLYFQHHLYRIAKDKQKLAAEVDATLAATSAE